MREGEGEKMGKWNNAREGVAGSRERWGRGEWDNVRVRKGEGERGKVRILRGDKGRVKKGRTQGRRERRGRKKGENVVYKHTTRASAGCQRPHCGST